jgi:hypothetical protein
VSGVTARMLSLAYGRSGAFAFGMRRSCSRDIVHAPSGTSPRASPAAERAFAPWSWVRARPNEHEGRLGCRGRAGGSHEARANERRQTQGEENSDLVFALRTQKNPRKPSRSGVQILHLQFLSQDGPLNFHERP